MKQAIVARRDLGMGPGKLAAQVAHASLAAFERADAETQSAWKRDGQTKVVLRTDGERSLFALKERAETAGLPAAIVRDAGRTELAPGTVTTIAIGPAPESAVDDITAHLTLY